MTEEKFTKLTDEDLELVAGGDEFHHAVITPSKEKGLYYIERVSFTGNAQEYAEFLAGKAFDSIKYSIGIGRTRGVPAEKLDTFIKGLEKLGYKIIRK